MKATKKAFDKHFIDQKIKKLISLLEILDKEDIEYIVKILKGEINETTKK